MAFRHQSGRAWWEWRLGASYTIIYYRILLYMIIYDHIWSYMVIYDYILSYMESVWTPSGLPLNFLWSSTPRHFKVAPLRRSITISSIHFHRYERRVFIKTFACDPKTKSRILLRIQTFHRWWATFSQASIISITIHYFYCMIPPALHCTKGGVTYCTECIKGWVHYWPPPECNSKKGFPPPSAIFVQLTKKSYNACRSLVSIKNY